MKGEKLFYFIMAIFAFIALVFVNVQKDANIRESIKQEVQLKETIIYYKDSGFNVSFTITGEQAKFLGYPTDSQVEVPREEALRIKGLIDQMKGLNHENN